MPLLGSSPLQTVTQFLRQAFILVITVVRFMLSTSSTVAFKFLATTISGVFDALNALVRLVLVKLADVVSGILPVFILNWCASKILYIQRLFRSIPTSSHKLNVKSEIKKRSEDEMAEKHNAVLAADYVLKTTGRFKLKYPDDPTMDMGSRMQKYWMIVEPGDQCSSLVLTIAPISRHCPLLEDDEETGEKTLKKETVKTLNELIGVLQLHPYIHPLVNMNVSQPVWVYYLSERKQLIMVQDNARSLKDIIYKEEFTERGKDWAEKYPQSKPTVSYFSIVMQPLKSAWHLAKSVPLLRALSEKVEFLFGRRCKRSPAISIDKMALYGRQILEAMVFLYKQGFPVLGHVQSGNIFVQDGVCRLGGYENTLLGCRSRLYRMCRDHLEHMDVIMFGHLLFEMCCGYELTTLVPTAKDYQAVRDVDGGEEIEEVLRCIFTKGFPHGIEHIVALPFFQSGMTVNPFNETKIRLSNEMISLLSRMRGTDHKQARKRR